LQHDAVRRVRSHGAMSGCVIGIRVLKRLNITSDFFTLCYPIILFSIRNIMAKCRQVLP